MWEKYGSGEKDATSLARLSLSCAFCEEGFERADVVVGRADFDVVHSIAIQQLAEIVHAAVPVGGIDVANSSRRGVDVLTVAGFGILPFHESHIGEGTQPAIEDLECDHVVPSASHGKLATIVLVVDEV